jgi:Holliday junction resolvase
MTPIKSPKQKGSTFERDAAEALTKKVDGSNWKRIPTSGAIGTAMNEPLLTGDISGNIASTGKRFKVEAKVGYGGAKQFALKKEWLDKVIEEASVVHMTPFLIGKFSGARSGVQIFVVLDIDTFAKLLNENSRLHAELHNAG